jgi:glycosyltransferase involved in cell wall biosynthesis
LFEEKGKMSNIAVVVTCHEAYLKWLPDALTSIVRQSAGASEYVVVLDGCSAALLDGRWRVVVGASGHPSAARNAGMAATSAKWVIFWDADNVMAEGYLEATARAITGVSSEVGIIYPDIQYCDALMGPQLFWATPQWDYWKLREENYIDTASVWRREALARRAACDDARTRRGADAGTIAAGDDPKRFLGGAVISNCVATGGARGDL